MKLNKTLKMIVCVLCLWVINQNSLAAGIDDFVIQVKTDFPGTSANNEFTIQTLGGGYNYNVDCNFDGSFEATAQTGDYTCVYGSPGVKIIRIEENNGDGTGFPRIFYDNSGDDDKLLEVAQWGTGKWTSMGAAFRGASNLQISAGDAPNLSNVTNLANMFRFAPFANPDTSAWDVSHVTTMHSMFRSATSANPDTSNWNTSNVTIMTDMFRNATSANPDMSGWNITQVTDMSLMFANVTLPTADYDAMLLNFSNQNITNAVVFDGGNSQYCSIPAQNARASLIANKSWTITDGNQCLNSDPLNDFVFTVLTNYTATDPTGFTIPTTGTGYKYNVDCNDDGVYEAFGITGDYTCDYSASGGVGTYTIRVQDAMGDKTGFPRIDFTTSTEADEIIDISQWGTGIWITMEGAFTQTSHLLVSAADAPDLSQVTSLENMFYLSTALTTVGSNWDTSNITNMLQMFYFAVLAQPQTSSWDISNVTNMTDIFAGAHSAQPDTSSWNTANVKFMAGMFYQAYAANPDTSAWNIEQVTTMEVMFFDVTLPTSDYDLMLSGFNSQILQSGVTFHGGNSKYCDITAHDGLEQNHNWTIADGGLDPTCPDPVDDFVIMVKTDNLGTSSDTQFTIPTNGAGYNYNVDCDDDNPGINIASSQTSNYTCDYAVAGTYTIRISDNVGDKTGFPRIYFNSQLDYRKIIDLKQWGSGIWVNMASAFFGASNMVVSATDVPDLSQVINAISMFFGASLANPNTTNWNVSSIQMMQSMFRDATTANPDTTNWNVSNVTSMFLMFKGATSANPNVGSWNTANVNNMVGIFQNASSAMPDMSAWDISGVTVPSSMENLLTNITLPTTLYDATLVNFDSQVTANGIVFDGGNSKYCDVVARDGLINNHGWIITDGGLDPSCSGTPADDFVIEVDTTITGSTSNTQFEIKTSGSGYNYNVDCDGANAGANTATAQTGNYICNYAAPGVYIIRISDNAGDKTGFPSFSSFFHTDAKKIIDLKQWGTGVWTSMANAFRGASNMVVSASDIPDLSSVSYLNDMFNGATAANPNVSGWNTSNVLGLASMFNGATSANPNVSSWNTANVMIMITMFNGAISATPDVSGWDITGITVPLSMESMLQGITLPTTLYDATLANFDSQVTANGIVFDGGNSKYCNVAARDGLINVYGWTITDGGLDPNCPDYSDDFIIEIDTTKTGSTTNTQFEINTAGTGYNYNVDCDGVNSGTNIATGQTGNYICSYAISGVYTIRISDNVGDKTGFPRINSASHLDANKIINLKQWGAGIWTSMNTAFTSANNMVVTATDVPDLSNVFSMSAMFSGASLANPNVSNWNTANVTNMVGVFHTATSAIPDMSSWDITGVTVPSSMESLLTSIILPTSLYDATLANFDGQAVTSGIIFNGGNSKYCNIVAHDGLINNHGWTITDGGLDANCPVVEDIFSNGFEDVIIFKAVQSQFNYDFSKASINDMDEQPLLIAKGLDEQKQIVIQIYLRNDVGQLQIRLDKLNTQDGDNVHWSTGQWQSIDNTQLTAISW